MVLGWVVLGWSYGCLRVGLCLGFGWPLGVVRV